MAKRFNPPPNWPTPPQGWIPDPSWQPDPAWGPAPAGWVFWVDDVEERRFQPARSDTAHADAAGSSAQSDETIFSTSRAEEVFASYSGIFNEQPPGEPVASGDVGHPGSGKPGEHLTGGTQGPPDGRASSIGEGVPDLLGDQAPSAAMPSYQAVPASAAFPPVLGGQPYFDMGSGAEPKKRNFFATPLGIVLAILVVIALTVGGVFAIKSLTDDEDDDSAGETSITYSAVSSSKSINTPIGSRSSASSTELLTSVDPSVFLGNSGRPNVEGEYKEYSGNNNAIFAIEKPGGADKPAYVIIDYASRGNSRVGLMSLRGYDSSGELTTAFSGFVGSSGSASTVFDGYKGDSTSKVKIKAVGYWRLRIYPISSAPVLSNGGKISGNEQEAFVFKGNSSVATVKSIEKEGVVSTRIEEYDLNDFLNHRSIFKDKVDMNGKSMTWGMSYGNSIVLVKYPPAKWELNIQ